MAVAQPYSGQTATGERSYLGLGSSITGDLEFPGAIEISGKIIGNVSAGSVTLAERAEVEGSLTATSITIRGQMKGKLNGGAVTLQSGARFEGEIIYSELSIESGAEVSGKVRRSKG